MCNWSLTNTALCFISIIVHVFIVIYVSLDLVLLNSAWYGVMQHEAMRTTNTSRSAATAISEIHHNLPCVLVSWPWLQPLLSILRCSCCAANFLLQVGQHHHHDYLTSYHFNCSSQMQIRSKFPKLTTLLASFKRLDSTRHHLPPLKPRLIGDQRRYRNLRDYTALCGY